MCYDSTGWLKIENNFCKANSVPYNKLLILNTARQYEQLNVDIKNESNINKIIALNKWISNDSFVAQVNRNKIQMGFQIKLVTW